MALTLREKLDRYPPNVVRLFARTAKHGTKKGEYQRRALTTAEIVAGSGLPEATILRLSQASNWEGVPVLAMLDYLRGCGADFNNPFWLGETMDLAQRCKNQNTWPRYVTRSDEYWHVLRPILLSLATPAEGQV